MPLSDDLKAILYECRAIPGELGLRPYTVTVVQGAWSGSYAGEGIEVATETAITESGSQPPKVRWLDDEQLALGGLSRGTVEIGPVTPDHTGGGTALSELVPAVSTGHTVHVKLTGPAHPTGALYAISEVKTDRALRWMIRAVPVSTI